MRYLVLLLLMVSCHSASTLDKLKPAVEKIETAALQQKGATIESLNIEGLRYELITVKEYYLYQLSLFYNHRSELTRNTLSQYNSHPHDSALNNLMQQNEQLDKQQEYLEDLSKNAAAGTKIYKLNYYLRAKTNKASIYTPRQLFMKANDLSEIKLDTVNTIK